MTDDTNKYLYFDIPKQERDSAIAFLLDALLKSKRACELATSSDDEFEEDVNIYLAHLLFAASLPDYQKAIQRYLSTNVSELAELVERNDDRIVRYFIYKVNADHLLVHLGIFQDLEGGNHLYGKSDEQYASMGQNYYQQAAQYNHRIYRKQTAIGSVLGKLSHRFLRYQTILRFARKEFFHFANQFRDDQFLKFCTALEKYEREKLVMETRDRFLDCYGEWRHTKSPESREKLMEAIKELKRVDPSFTFQLD